MLEPLKKQAKSKECGGSGICKHGRERSTCKECGGSGICQHGQERSTCKECGGSGICEHRRERSSANAAYAGKRSSFAVLTRKQQQQVFNAADVRKHVPVVVRSPVCRRRAVGRKTRRLVRNTTLPEWPAAGSRGLGSSGYWCLVLQSRR